MLMSAYSMCMAMSHFFWSCLPHRLNGYFEGQIDTCQWVVGIYIEVEFSDLDNGGRVGAIVAAKRYYLTGTERLLFSTVYLFACDPLHTLGVMSPISFLMRDSDRKIITCNLAYKCILQREQYTSLTVQTEHRMSVVG